MCIRDRAEGHEGACVLPEEGGEPDAPAACTKTEGCTLAEGHEGDVYKRQSTPSAIGAS